MFHILQGNIKEISGLVNQDKLRLNFLSGHTNKIFMAFVFLFFPINLMFVNSSFANPTNIDVPNYDSISITPDTWQQVELSYSDIINDKKYPAEVKLLRPIKWLQENGMDKVGNEVTLSIPEFGVVNVKARVTAIKSVTLDTSKIDWSKMNSRPVIGMFKRYAPVVKTYTFKDLSTGDISTINATPNHPFYVKNKGKFMPIEGVAPTDQLINSSGQPIKLICGKGQNSHCGKLYNTNGKPVPVYNLEVYQKHVYFIGKSKILVHNQCRITAPESIDDAQQLIARYGKNQYKNETHGFMYKGFSLRGDSRTDEIFNKGFELKFSLKKFKPRNFNGFERSSTMDFGISSSRNSSFLRSEAYGQKNLFLIDGRNIEGYNVAQNFALKNPSAAHLERVSSLMEVNYSSPIKNKYVVGYFDSNNSFIRNPNYQYFN